MAGNFGSMYEGFRSLAAISTGDLGPHDIWYVDASISGGDGKTWATAFDTVKEAVDACSDDDTVLITGEISEHIDYSTYAAGPQRIHLLGAGAGLLNPIWLHTDHDTHLIDLEVRGWTIENIKFRGPKRASLIKLGMPTDAGGAEGSTVKNCWLRRPSGEAGAIGIDITTPFDCHILNNDIMIGGSSGYGIAASVAGFTFPNGIMIIGNRFQECGNQIDLSLINSHVLYNTFQAQGHTQATTKHLDLGGGNDNVVFGNFFGGDYAIASNSYVAGTGDDWAGNYSMDTTAAGVGDNGVTIAVPST